MNPKIFSFKVQNKLIFMTAIGHWFLFQME